MSGNLGPQASTKGETSKPTSKTGYDRIDINKLFKSKTTEPVAKTVTQKHGMQTLGKAPPARRAGASVVVAKPESTSSNNDVTNNSSVPLPQQQPPSSLVNLSQQDQQKWTNSSHPHGPPPIMSAPVVQPRAGPPSHVRPGPDVAGNYQSQRFAQEFPSLEAGSDPPRGSVTSTSSHPGTGSGPQNSSKSHDNQYGPGPILRPQTEGSWIQGGGRGPPGPHSQNVPIREQGPERPNLGGPTPPPMSLGQGGPAPPPLGAYPMQFRMAPPFMYPNGPGYYPQSGQGMPRYGMQVPPGAPPPREHSDSHSRESNRGRGPPPPMRPTQQFAVKPIIREEDMKRMDDIDQEGSWSSVKDEIDYNKKISFSDEDDDKRENSSRKSAERNDDETRPTARDSRDKKPIRILERQHSSNNERDREQHRERDRYESISKDQDREEDWNKGRNAPQQQYDSKDRGGIARRGRDTRDEDWRGNRFEEDARNKKGPPSRPDPRSTDYGAKQFSNLPPRLLRQQQHQHNSQPYSTSQRRSPSPPVASGTDRDRDFQPREREREWESDKRSGTTTQYRILERNRGDSESSSNSIRDKRGSNEYNSRSSDKESNRGSSDSTRDKDQSIESLKDKMEGLDVRGDKEDKLAGYGRTAKFSTSSWADQVDDEDNARDYENYQKGLNTAPSKPEVVKEERTVPKRVYIQQRKVENMTTVKVEVQPESIKPTIEPANKQEQKSSSSSDKNNRSPAVWGERDEREKTKSDIMKETSEESLRNRSVPMPMEIIISDKARQLHQNRDEIKENKTDKRSQEKELRDRNDYDKGQGRERYGSNQEAESRQDREKNWSRPNERPNERPRPSRWGSNDYRNDNRTPERDANASSGRSSATDNSSSMKVEGDRDRGHEIEKSRSAEMIKENSIDKDCKGSRDDYGKHKEPGGTFDKRNKNAHEEDIDSRGNSKGGIRNRDNRERTGHAVYQPRGGWGRQDGRGGGGGKATRGRDYYDNRPRRNEYDRERDDHDPKEDHDDIDNMEKPTDKDSVISSDERKDLCDEDTSRKDAGAGDTARKGLKSPVTNKRNPRGGGRLHGYGPPSDKPFSSGNANKEEEPLKEKISESTSKANPSSSGPVPLMELGDISPPSMMAGRARHHGRGKGVEAIRPRQDYSSRGGSKRGRGGDAKPLMSLNSNELEKHEGDTEPESQDDETKKNSKRKESSKGHEKYRSNQTELRNSSKDKTGSEPSNQDVSNNKGKGTKTARAEGEMYQCGNANETGAGSASDNSENVDSDGPKKGSSKEKLNFGCNKTSSRIEKQSQQVSANKDRRVKHPPYDARSAVPPRFQQKSSNPNQTQFSNSKGSSESTGKESNESNVWEKSSVTLKTDHNSEQISQSTSQTDSKIEFSSSDVKPPTSSTSAINASSVMIDGNGGPLKTMIFENRNFKNVSKPAGSGKGNEMKDCNMTSGLELTKDIGLSFGKDTGNDSRDMDFGSTFDDPTISHASQNMSPYPTTKPMPIGPNRNFQTHQASPVSPLAKDLTAKIQAVRQVWDKPAMPSVTEQTASITTEDSNSFHSGFTVSDSFKTDVSRDYGSSLQQSQSGYAPGSSPALAPISKPDSSTSPNSSSHRQVKPPQQQSMENHVGMSSSPFAYAMPQQHQGTFGGPSAIPSPPTAMVYGNSQGLGGHTGVYQAFPHVDTSQVMNNSARSQYGQYSNPPQGTGTTPYGLNTSIFMTSMDTGGYQQMSSYQQHSLHQQQHSQSGQGPPTNRSPGPMPSSGGSSSGVMNSMKSQNTGAHPNMSHQVMGTPSQQQQAYSQMSHHMPHHQLAPVGHVSSKSAGPGGYSQTGLTTQSQMYIPYDPSQQVLNYGGQSYVSSGMRNAPPGGPPPSATPPVQGMQGSSNYYSGNAANQVFPGTNQGSGLQQLHVAVAPNPQALQNLQTATQQYGQQQFQITGFNQLQGYSQQAASTVSALNLGGQLIRPPTAHSHYNMKQGMDMVQQSHGLKHEPMMNPTWNAQGFSLNQGFHGGNKPGGNPDRNSGPNIGNQRKGSHQQQMGMSQMGGAKYMPTGGYSSQQCQKGRFAAPGPIQRPLSTSPSTGPPGSIGSAPGGMRMVGIKANDNLNKHMSSINQPGSASEEGLLDKLMTESHNRSIASTPDPSKVMMSGSRLMEDTNPDHNGADNVTLKNHNLTMSPANKSPIITSSESKLTDSR